MKKFLSVLMSILMLTSVVAGLGLTAYADDESYIDGYYTYTISDGNATITDCDETISGDVVIPPTLGDCPVTNIGYRAFYNCVNMTGITFPDSVISIDNQAFYRCLGLANITFGKNLNIIGGDAFSYCTNLTSVIIPDSVISIGGEGDTWSDPFLNCSSLESINVDGNNKNYASQNGVLFNKDKTSLIYYPIGNKNSEYIIPDDVMYITSYAFWNCQTLKSVNIPNSVINISGFYNCSNLKDIYYDGTETEWQQIYTGFYMSEILKNATIHYAKASEPTTPTVPSDNQSTTTQPSTTTTAPTATTTASVATNDTTTAKATASKPKATTAKKVKAGKKKVDVQWKKVNGVSGYQVQVATDKKFKKNKKTVTIKKQKTTKTTVKNLKSKKKYYVRVRTYKTVNGKKVYSKWSKVKTVKTK